MTLPLARQWFNSTNWHKDMVATSILRRHATMDDLPMVRTAFTQYLSAAPENINTYGTCSLLDILRLFPDIGLIPEVERVYLETGYSPARMRAADAMQSNAPDYFAEAYAYECLWDCEEVTRQIGCESVPLAHPGVFERLRELANDPFEADDVRKEADGRLSERA